MFVASHLLTTMNEKALIEKILQGNSSAFSMLIDSHKDRVFSLALRVTGNREDAEEVLQDVFLKVYDNLARYEGNSKFSTWLYSIAYNTAVSKIRSEKRHENEFGIDDYRKVDAKDLVEVLEPMRREQQRKYLRKAMEQLAKDEALLIELFYLNEMKVTEIVEIMGETEGSIKVKLHRTRKKLHKLLTLELKDEVDMLY